MDAIALIGHRCTEDMSSCMLVLQVLESVLACPTFDLSWQLHGDNVGEAMTWGHKATNAPS